MFVESQYRDFLTENWRRCSMVQRLWYEQFWKNMLPVPCPSRDSSYSTVCFFLCCQGFFGLFGEVLCRINVDTVGLLFESWKGRTGLNLQDENTLEKASPSNKPEILALGKKFRHFLDPNSISDVIELMNPSSLATISKLFPDGKYNIALLQHSFKEFGETEMHGQEQIRGKSSECYVSRKANSVIHLLKTQKHLDANQVQFYVQQLEHAIASGSSSRPTALVFDFFLEGDIRKESETAVGRRKQRRNSEACEASYLESDSKAWILLDGHHKVEAAVSLGCSLNFLIISPCAEPYSALEADDPYGSLLTRQVSFPFLWPSAEAPCAHWEKANLCKHSPMLLSSRELPEDWLNAIGCFCFSCDPCFPKWAYELLIYYDGDVGKAQMLQLLKDYLGEDHELFTTYFHVEMDDLPDELSSRFTSDPSFRHLIPDWTCYL